MLKSSDHSSLFVFVLILMAMLVVSTQVTQFFTANAAETEPRDSDEAAPGPEDETNPENPTPDGDPDEPLRVSPDRGTTLFWLVWFLSTLGI